MKKPLFLFTVILLLLVTGCGPSANPASPVVPSTAIPTSPQPAVPTQTALPATLTPVIPTQTPVPPTSTPPGTMELSSDAFAPEGEIPARYAQVPFEVALDSGTFVCPGAQGDKANVSPALSWVNVPAETKSLALVMVDDLHYAYAEMPEGTFFSHWTVYNISPSLSGLPEDIPAELTLADGSLQGINGYPAPYDQGYGGPCPGVGEKHLYLFTLYALDTTLNLPPGADHSAVMAAIAGHILSQAELRGYYTGQ